MIDEDAYWAAKIDVMLDRIICELCNEPLETPLEFWTNDDPMHHVAICEDCHVEAETENPCQN